MKVSGLDREFFQLVFSEVYQERWKSAGKSQESFAAEVRSRTGCSYEKQTVSEWLNGKRLPSKEALEAICDILRMEETSFRPLSYNIRYSPDYADFKNEKIAQLATECFGIDLKFLEGLQNLIPDFGSRFPLNAPLLCDTLNYENAYERVAHEETSKTGKKKRLFQIERNGKSIVLTEWDLKIIRILQNNAIKFICSCMEKISARIIDSEKAVNLRFVELNSIEDWEDGSPLQELTEDELQSLDRYGLYTDEAREKYHPADRKAYTLEELEQLISVKNGGKENGKY